jgi:hypothetical protein
MGFFDPRHYNFSCLEMHHYNSPIWRTAIIISSLFHPAIFYTSSVYGSTVRHICHQLPIPTEFVLAKHVQHFFGKPGSDL